MNPAHKTYLLALAKEAGIVSKALGIAKGVGRFGASVPLWMGGANLAESLFGKAPDVKTVVVPQSKYLMMRQRAAGGGAQLPQQPPLAGTGGMERRVYQGGGFGG